MWYTVIAPTSWSSGAMHGGAPLSENVKVTVFMDGACTGPVRMELFRRQPNPFNEAVHIAMLEDHCDRSAQGHTPHVEASEGPTPMEISLAKSARPQRTQCAGGRCFVVIAFTLPGTGYTLARPTLHHDIEYPKIEVNPDAKIAWPGVCQSSFQPTARGSGKQAKEYTLQGNPRPRSTSAYESRSKEPKIDGSNIHRRSDEFGQGNEVSTNIGSPTTPINQDRSAERQRFGRSSTDGTEEGPVMDLEDKTRPPPQVPSGTPAGLDENLDPPDESPPAQDGTNTSIQPQSGRSTAKKKTAKSKPSRKKIKAPDSETEDRGDLMSDDQLTKAYRKKELYTFLINDAVMGSFEAEALFDLKLNEIKQSVQSLYELLVPLVGEPDQAQKQSTQSKSTRSTLTVARSTPIVPPGDQTAASSPYVSATEEVESSDSEEPPRMTLGPAGAAMLQIVRNRPPDERL
ncbi:unnamed protein product [Phytophthora fragariaefolia]|uniref:Unnamed protein product n=1 Tax=Phytophthora fragariaefolia TaxID=1490495 RepID=A0A9W6WWR9_9STRA|nr:unnamed protein product [Phytophthora fragariaefolia]